MFSLAVASFICMEIKNIPEVATRIIIALRNGERIILCGDADLDGAASVIILKEAIEILAPHQYKLLEVYFPNREKEGYGLNLIALKQLKDKAPALLITLDCGIGNVREVELAKKMGFEVIIIDHHEILPEVPKASIIVDPKQKSDPYPFKEFACAGIVYKLVKFLLQSVEKSYKPEKFLELVMLATLADQMPLKEENEKLVTDGILSLKYTKRPGIKALMELTEFRDGETEEIRKKILFPLNKAGLDNHLHVAYLLLTENSDNKAKKFARELLIKSTKKRGEVEVIYNEIESRIANYSSSPDIIFEGNSSWPLALVGAAASKICRKYQKPAFLFKIDKKESVGSVKVPSGGNAVKAMNSCRKLLKTYGGHPQAAGFRIENENLEKFKNCLIKYYKESR